MTLISDQQGDMLVPYEFKVSPETLVLVSDPPVENVP